MSAARLEYFKGNPRKDQKKSRWYWHVRSANGQISVTSQGYKHGWTAKRAANHAYPYLAPAVKIDKAQSFPGPLPGAP